MAPMNRGWRRVGVALSRPSFRAKGPFAASSGVGAWNAGRLANAGSTVSLSSSSAELGGVVTRTLPDLPDSFAGDALSNADTAYVYCVFAARPVSV